MVLEWLFASTVVGRLVLAAALVWLLLGPGRALESRARTVWGFVAVLVGVVAVDNLVYEGLRWVAADAPADGGAERARRIFYNFAYLFHGALSAALPAAVLERLSHGRQRRVFRVVLAATGGLFLLAVVDGALPSWEVLLDHTRILSFLAIAGYLAFWALLLLGRIPPVDVYFAGFLGARTLFVLLLPVQEVFFQWAGRDAATRFWAVNQALQLAMTVVQLVLVLALARLLTRGRPVRRVRAPAAV